MSLLGISGDLELLQGVPLVSAFSNSKKKKKLGIWDTLPSPQAAQQGGACSLQGPQLVSTSSRELIWLWLLPGSWSGLKSLWELCSSESSLQLGSALLRVTSAFSAYSGKEGPSGSDQCRGFPEALLSCFPTCLRSFPAKE